MGQGNRIGMKQVENKPAQNSVPDCAGATFHSWTKHLQTSESTAVQMPPLHTFCYSMLLVQIRMHLSSTNSDGQSWWPRWTKTTRFFLLERWWLATNPETSYELDHWEACGCMSLWFRTTSGTTTPQSTQSTISESLVQEFPRSLALRIMA